MIYDNGDIDGYDTNIEGYDGHADGYEKEIAKLEAENKKLKAQLDLIRKDEGMVNRMLELFENRRDVDAENKALREQLESVKAAEQAATVDLNLYVEKYNNCEKLRATDWERLTKERDELKAEVESLQGRRNHEFCFATEKELRDQCEKLAAALEIYAQENEHVTPGPLMTKDRGVIARKALTVFRKEFPK